MKLFHKFLAALLLTALLPLLIAGASLLREMERSLRLATLNVQRGVAEATSVAVAGYLENAQSLLAVAQKSPGLQGPRDRRAVLESVLNNFPLFTDLSIRDRSGRDLYTLSRFQKPAGPAPDAWETVVREIQQKGSCAGAVEWENDLYPRMRVYVPVEAEPGRPTGYLEGRINLLDLSERVKGMDLGVGGQVSVADGTGRLIARSAGPETFGERDRLRDEMTPSGAAAGEYRGSDGRTILWVKTRVPGVNWSVVFEQPAEAALSLLYRARRRIRLSFFLAGALALVLCVGLTRALVRPLKEIETAIAEMTGGRFDASIATRSRDEIGSVARKLREAQRAVEKKVRQATVGLLAHRLGHDLRQPFTAIRNSLEVVRRHAAGSDETARAHLDLIGEEVAHGTEVVEEMLTLGRERPPLLRRQDLNKLVRAAVQPLAAPEGSCVTWRLSPSPVECPLDENEARRAVANVAQNALEALGPAGSVEIATEARGGAAVVRVTDDGCGIPRERLDKVFEEFYTTKPQGTGLGMGIVRKVMERHRGTVTISGREGGGTIVELTFPLERRP